MTFHRGASLTTATTLGYADTADLGPSAGNGFYRQWPDDLALLQDIGLTDLRITLDWARLQQKPGDLDGDWVERFENILVAADAIGLRAWATLYDGSVPRWFDNEGGFDDADAFVKWWPRWVEKAADRFGDLVHGLGPVRRPPGRFGPAVARHVGDPRRHAAGVASIEGLDGLAHIGSYVGRMDRLGPDACPGVEPAEHAHRRAPRTGRRSLGHARRGRPTRIDGEPVVITGFRPGHDDHDECAPASSRRSSPRSTLRSTTASNVEVAFVEPAIAGHDSEHGLLDSARAVTATADRLPRVAVRHGGVRNPGVRRVSTQATSQDVRRPSRRSGVDGPATPDRAQPRATPRRHPLRDERIDRISALRSSPSTPEPNRAAVDERIDRIAGVSLIARCERQVRLR